jgi:hypothetical protein
MITVPKCRCERCDHAWTPRRGYKKKRESGKVMKLPRICPECKSEKWNVKPRKYRRKVVV